MITLVAAVLSLGGESFLLPLECPNIIPYHVTGPLLDIGHFDIRALISEQVRFKEFSRVFELHFKG